MVSVKRSAVFPNLKLPNQMYRSVHTKPICPLKYQPWVFTQLKRQDMQHFLNTETNDIISELAKWNTKQNVLHGKICQQLLFPYLPCVVSSSWLPPSTSHIRGCNIAPCFLMPFQAPEDSVGSRRRSRTQDKAPFFCASHTVACTNFHGTTVRNTEGCTRTAACKEYIFPRGRVSTWHHPSSLGGDPKLEFSQLTNQERNGLQEWKMHLLKQWTSFQNRLNGQVGDTPVGLWAAVIQNCFCSSCGHLMETSQLVARGM